MHLEQLILSLLFFLVKVDVLKTERYRLDIRPVAPVYWVSNEDILVNEGERGYLYSVVEREVVEEFEKEGNQILGYCDMDVLICEWENREMESPEEYSTHLIQEGSDGERVVDIELKPTVEVVECKEKIILRTVAPVEEKLFEFSDDLYEVEDYQEDMFSPNFRKLLSKDDLGSYWITEFGFNLHAF
ncbi:hypothetical protein K8R14_04915 [bacterium]|nr:hypothetical protein [bacterium]